MNIEYCEAKSNDAKEIINYLNIVTGQTDNLNYGNNEINLNTIQEMEFIQEMHENDHSVMILAKDGDKIVGIATLKGHKQSRLKHRADLEVVTDNEIAIALYHKFGFEIIGTYENYMKLNDRYLDVYLMNLYL